MPTEMYLLAKDAYINITISITMTMIHNQPSGNSTSFVGKINELEKLLFSSATNTHNTKVVSFRKKHAIKKIKMVFRQLDHNIATTVRQLNG